MQIHGKNCILALGRPFLVRVSYEWTAGPSSHESQVTLGMFIVDSRFYFNCNVTDPSLPAGRRREIDTVMKKARSSPNSNGYWDKKLLEVEAKDPNRYIMLCMIVFIHSRLM